VQQPDQQGFGLAGSGMFIINPPYTLHDEMLAVLPYLTEVLGQYDGANYLLEQRGRLASSEPLTSSLPARRASSSALHPRRPVHRPAVVALLQVAEHVAPGAVEVGIGLVPFAAVAPAGVVQCDAGRLAVDVDSRTTTKVRCWRASGSDGGAFQSKLSIFIGCKAM
jgi:hypothetical protein